jgi:hydroxyacylglutathione hydrolase
MAAEIRLVPCLSDNYAVILRDPASGAVILVDAPEAARIERALEAEKWKLSHILVTHHHGDHVQGIPALKQRYGATVIGPKEAEKGGMLDQVVGEGDTVKVGSLEARVLETPGHTAGHIIYIFDREKLLFAGDTLFAVGCGRAIERPAAVLWNSLLKFRDLPGDTKMYCGHEYTLANARFAVTVDPRNAALKARLADLEKTRAAGKPTLPSTMAEERATNPFLRADDPAVAEAVGMKGADAAKVFTEIRERKNSFRG